MSAPTRDLDGAVAVVTGGAAGIGWATAQELLDRGAQVAVLDLGVEEVPAHDGLRALRCDITDEGAVRTALADVASGAGRLDVVVNNAGIGATGTVEESDAATFRRVLDVNVVGTAVTSAAALPFLRRSERPAVVNMCSIAAHVGLVQRAAYSASKGAVLALTRAMAADHVGEGIRVNAVSPGTVRTAWVDRLLAQAADPEAELDRLRLRQPTGRLVEPEEVARAVAYLASPVSSGTTGTVLHVDGGMHAVQIPRDGR